MSYTETQAVVNMTDKAAVEVAWKPFVWLACSVISLLKVAYL